ncbi:MAG: 2-phospho-L-lactate guanylyltransferase [Proteobacteria bacterium]|nr:2-phospho-L-lactate guanylyltransferase [Pseudomonadota bacterium]
MTRDATWAATWAVVPVKTLDAAKRRLAGALDPAARRGLSLAMLADVLDALDATAGLDGAAVVSRDSDVMELARRRGLRVIPETGAGLNAAVTQAANVLSAEGCARLLVMPADLPLAAPEEIAQILAALPEAPGLTLVPDRHGVGTNGFLCSPPDAVAPSFGAGSFARHLEAARDAGIPATVLRLPGLGLDIDTPEDLRAFMEAPGATWTHAALRAARSAAPLAVGGER